MKLLIQNNQIPVRNLSIRRRNQSNLDRRKKKGGRSQRSRSARSGPATARTTAVEQPTKLADGEVDPRKGRRPRALTPETRQNLLANPPRTLKEVLDKFCLQELALEHWLKKRPVLIGDFQSVERALSRINAHEIRSLPVVNDKKFVTGLIDIMDITKYIIESIRNPNASASDAPNVSGFRQDFMTKAISNLFSLDKLPSYIASNQISLLQATRCFVKFDEERFMIVDRAVSGNVAQISNPEEYLDGLVTQSDVIRFLAQNSMLMRQDPHFQKTLQELNLGTRHPLIVSQNDQVSKAFLQMVENRTSSAAVVDNEGKLVANLSASDLKGLNRRNLNVLKSTTLEFLNRDWNRGWWTKPIYLNPRDPLYHVVLQFVASKVHRMYLIDDHGMPVGEVSQMDILKELLKID